MKGKVILARVIAGFYKKKYVDSGRFIGNKDARQQFASYDDINSAQVIPFRTGVSNAGGLSQHGAALFYGQDDVFGYVNVSDSAHVMNVGGGTRTDNWTDSVVLKSQLLNLVYPVGSLYWSKKNVSPATFLGGTWKQIRGAFVYAATSNVDDTVRGKANHTHNYGIQVGGYYYDNSWEGDANAGLLKWDASNTISLKTDKPSVGTFSITVNGGNTDASKTNKDSVHYRTTSNTSYSSSMPPYLNRYCWERTA